MKVGDKVSTEIGEGVIARKDVAGSMWHNRWMVFIPKPTKEFAPGSFPTNPFGFFEDELTLIENAE